MANKDQVISQKELILQTQEELKASGVQISSTVLELAIRGYNEVKRANLLKGSSYEEENIGIVQPSWRRVSKSFNPSERFTPKLVVLMDDRLKLHLKHLLIASPEFRKAVGAEEL